MCVKPTSVVNSPLLQQLLSQTGDPTGLVAMFDNLCQGSIAVDQDCRVIWLSESYRPLLGLPADTPVLGRSIETLIPNSQMARVVASGEPNFLDLMQIEGRWCVVTRLPLKNAEGAVTGAIGFVFYDQLDALYPFLNKAVRLRQQLQSTLLRPSKYALDDLIGSCDSMQRLKRQAHRAALLDTTLLLLGETGTGKELLAQGIHAASSRSQGPFVGINMAALPDTLVEAELFGVAPGAFTGADPKGRQGKLQLAQGGTLFLDEIADMPLSTQAKLLRVLQEREVEALGSNRLEPVDVRIIAATSQHLEDKVAQGQFRADLYYRINVLSLTLPPLRERLQDLAELSQALLKQISRQTNLPPLSLSPAALSAMTQHPWPGNIRELRNRLERAQVLSENASISPADLGLEPQQAHPSLADEQLRQERQQLLQALQLCQGNRSQAAKHLGISRATLYVKLRKHNLDNK
ncbi:sigma-54 interaction domain-containing protein [Balneatrix alpica]|uniref:sigma-54 interaction domain-containing protein n=1 Tax=Balneatrix alpica TaxID=75684 RepID=UPI00273A2EA3|nr:sigma 54-interacting transcriptional regulator [Balneatrix alpica]